MKSNLKILSLSAFFTAGILSHAFAQQNEEPTISVQISALALDRDISELKLLSGESVEELDIFTSARSRVISYSGPQRLTFFREHESDQTEEGVIRQPVASVVLSEQHPRYLLFFLRRSGSEERYSIVALPDDVTTFRPGSFRFVNLSPHRIAIRVGEESRTLNERDFTDVSGNFEHGNHYQALFVSLPEGRDPVLSYSGRIFFNRIMRMLYVIFPGDSGEEGSIRFRAIPDAIRDSS